MHPAGDPRGAVRSVQRRIPFFKPERRSAPAPSLDSAVRLRRAGRVQGPRSRPRGGTARAAAGQLVLHQGGGGPPDPPVSSWLGGGV
jgi:hypothetical protein